MATLTTQSLSVTGTDLTLTAATATVGDKVPPGCNLVVRNGSGASITVTVVVPGATKYGIANPDFTKAVPAGATCIFAHLPADLADPIDGLVTFTCSSVTTVTVGAFR